jgi:hypothetical protein
VLKEGARVVVSGAAGPVGRLVTKKLVQQNLRCLPGPPTHRNGSPAGAEGLNPGPICRPFLYL